MKKAFEEKLNREGIIRVGRNLFVSGGMKITLFLKDGNSRNGRNTKRYLNEILKKRSWQKTDADNEKIRYLTNLAKFEGDCGVVVRYDLNSNVLRLKDKQR